MKVLVLGGTGAMGVHLSKLLSDNGDDVYVTSRRQRLNENNIRYITGDAKNDDFIKEILKEHWDVIVDFMVYNTKDLEQRLDDLLNATSQYIFLSSARVYAYSEAAITEDSPRLLDVITDKEYLATDEYALSKARQENLLFDSKYSNWTIVRPYITYSDQRLQLGVLEKEAWLYRALKGRPIAFSFDINSKMTTLTHGLDVANGIVSLIGKDSALGEAFHITNNKSLTWEAVLNIYTETLAKKLSVRPKVVLQSMDNFNSWYFSNYQIQYDRLYDRKFDNTKINKYINTVEFKDTEVGLKECLNNFIQNPEYLYLDWYQEAIKDKQLSVRANLNEIPSFNQKCKYLFFRYLNN
jgi:nucleoside-diphosphate-sugar epimerase